MRQYDTTRTVEDFFQSSTNHYRNHQLAIWLINLNPKLTAVEFLSRLTILMNTDGELEHD